MFGDLFWHIQGHQMFIGPLDDMCMVIKFLRILKDGASFGYCAYVLRKEFEPPPPPPIQRHFCSVYDYVKREDLSKGYQNPKRKLGVTTHFSEIIELQFGKKLPYILCTLTLF